MGCIYFETNRIYLHAKVSRLLHKIESLTERTCYVRPPKFGINEPTHYFDKWLLSDSNDQKELQVGV